MRVFRSSTIVAALAGSMLVGNVGLAMAGADDGGAEAFFDKTGPGSARGMVAPQPATQAPGVTDAAAGSQPNASVTRTGVAQALSHRPHVAVTRMGQNTVGAPLHRTRVGTRNDGSSPRLTAAHAVGIQRVQHAMHRGADGEGHQS